MIDRVISFAKEWGGWIIGIPVLIIAVATYFYNRRILRLVCILSQPISLISVKKEVRDRIKIYYENRKIENLVLLRIQIRNDGNVPIKGEQVVKPLEFIFEENAEIIDYSVISTSPEEIEVNLEQNKNSIVCNFDLLNPKDEITLQFVYTDSTKRPKVRGRIEGIRKIEVLPEEMLRKSTQVGNFYILFGITLILASAFLWLFSLGDVVTLAIFVLYAVALITLGIIASKDPNIAKMLEELSYNFFSDLFLFGELFKYKRRKKNSEK